MTTTYYANPAETTFTGATFTFTFGAYGDTRVVVFQRPDHIDSALETATECLFEKEPGHFMAEDSSELQDLYREACKGAGVSYEAFCEGELGLDDPGAWDDIQSAVTADMTYTEQGYLISYEWTFCEDDSEPFPAPRFNREDIIRAYYCYWKQYAYRTDGFQTADAAVSAATRMGLGLNPELSADFDTLTPNAMAIYRKLALTDGR